MKINWYVAAGYGACLLSAAFVCWAAYWLYIRALAL